MSRRFLRGHDQAVSTPSLLRDELGEFDTRRLQRAGERALAAATVVANTRLELHNDGGPLYAASRLARLVGGLDVTQIPQLTQAIQQPGQPIPPNTPPAAQPLRNYFPPILTRWAEPWIGNPDETVIYPPDVVVVEPIKAYQAAAKGQLGEKIITEVRKTYFTGRLVVGDVVDVQLDDSLPFYGFKAEHLAGTATVANAGDRMPRDYAAAYQLYPQAQALYSVGVPDIQPDPRRDYPARWMPPVMPMHRALEISLIIADSVAEQ